jgi:hypothetical protein
MSTDQSDFQRPAQLSSTENPLKGDIERLKSMWRGLARSGEVISRARMALQDSLELLKDKSAR